VTPAFARAHRDDVASLAGFARLADTGAASRGRFADAVAMVHTAGEHAAGGTGRDPSPRPELSFPTSEVAGSVITARTVLAGGLAVFATVVGLGGALVVGQGLVRHHAVRPESQHVERAACGIDHAAEFDQEAVADGLEDSPPVPGDGRIEEFAPELAERAEGALLIGLHEAAVADDIGHEYGGQAAFHDPFSFSGD